MTPELGQFALTLAFVLSPNGACDAAWGGVGTIVGGAFGALIVAFIQSGIVAAGLSGFYVQFFNGLIIILSLLGHRWNQKRYR